MLASITPLGERGRGRRWPVTAGWYAVGCVTGGAVLGVLAAALGSLASLMGSPRGALLALGAAAACLPALLVDAGVAGWRPPGPRRQVDEDWLHRYRGWVVGLGFGVQLGLGVTTIVTTAALYSALVLGALVSPLAALGAGIVFGSFRALPLLAVRGAVDPASLRRVVARVAAWSHPATALTVGTQALTMSGLALLGLLDLLTGTSIGGWG